MKKIFYILLFILILLFAGITTASSYYSEKAVANYLPYYQKRFKRLGIDFRLSHYQRGWLHSTANWQLSIKGFPDYRGQMIFDHVPFVNAGINWGRINVSGQTASGETLIGTIALKPNGKIESQHQLLPLNALVANSKTVDIAINGDIFKRRHLDILIKSQAGQYLFQPFPPFELTIHSQWTANATAGTRYTGNPLVVWVSKNNTQHHVVFQTITDNANEFLRITGNIYEHIDMPTQIPQLSQREALLTALNHSEFSVEIAADSPYQNLIKETLGRSPFLLKTPFKLSNDRLMSRWKIQNGKIILPTN